MEKYVIPAKRRDKGNQIVTVSSMHKQSTTRPCLASKVQVLQIGRMKFQIILEKEVKPTFRTPCNQGTIRNIESSMHVVVKVLVCFGLLCSTWPDT